VSDQRVVVIGGSAGALDALRQIARRLPADFAAPVFIVVHIPPHAPSLLAHILEREGPLVAKQAADGETFQNGVIYVAAPDRHLLIEEHRRVRSVRGPSENRHRPAIDPLFRSAALAYGAGVVGVVLSGTLDDGTSGLLAVKKRGGIAIVQDPEDAVYGSMPLSALEHVEVDSTLPAEDIAKRLELALAEDRPAVRTETLQDDDRPGRPSPYSCPDCGGVLWAIEEGDIVRYRCRVGHAYSPDTIYGAQQDEIEQALWSAVKTLEESARMARRLADAERSRGHDWMAVRFEERATDAGRRVDVLRRFLTHDLDGSLSESAK
jgi:two-component system, chemotaxis family, protein-glutamate methylesterase/glutaminase